MWHVSMNDRQASPFAHNLNLWRSEKITVRRDSHEVADKWRH
ncbi:hypothetical protein Q7C_2056 [Methylophaga frappieri]|uniref:Uncharacterized protein n=1 Tax=Methylophaga frappieri (strain ATCC BAA-2434 / DSM 25690 / JAM7) TaxID=754477 RepID=I1YJV2_METFJ|nr:hypothetical protein Q7C_2056 [Methylophaga frappieri]